MTSLHWQTGLQNRQCHVPCTLGKTSKCSLYFHDQDLVHYLVKQARDHLWLNKTLPNIFHVFNIILPKPYQIFNKNLIQQLIQYNSGNVGRMIYFRENSTLALLQKPGNTTKISWDLKVWPEIVISLKEDHQWSQKLKTV